MFWTTLWNCFTIQRTSSDLEITNLYMNIWNVTWLLSFLSYIMQRFICNEINSHLSTFMSSCSQTFLSHIKWREIIHWTRFMWPQLNYTSCCCRIHLICLERQPHKVAVRLCAAQTLTQLTCTSGINFRLNYNIKIHLYLAAYFLFGTLTQFDPLTIPFRKSGPSSCTFRLVYALDVSCSFSETFAVQKDKRAYLNLAVKQQIHM